MKDTERGGNQDDKDNHAWLQWKMGQVITRMAAEDKECEIVAGIDTCEGRLNGLSVLTVCKTVM